MDAWPPDREGTETAGSFQNVATFLRARGRAKESLAWYGKALEVNPKSPAVLFNYSIALQMLARWDESDDALLSAVRNGYHDPDFAIQGRAAFYAKRSETDPRQHEQLVTFLRKADAADPRNPRTRAALGKALFEAQDCAGSHAIFLGLVARHPRNTEALNVLALTSWCLGDLAAARGYLERSLAVNADQPEIRGALSDLDRGAVPRPRARQPLESRP